MVTIKKDCEFHWTRFRDPNFELCVSSNCAYKAGTAGMQKFNYTQNLSTSHLASLGTMQSSNLHSENQEDNYTAFETQGIDLDGTDADAPLQVQVASSETRKGVVVYPAP